MYEILPWVGLGILLFLCLPIPLTQKLILAVSTWVLRLMLIGLLAAGVYLAFRPGELPASLSATLADHPQLLKWLPAPGSAAFGLCLACWIVLPFVPLLAAFDATRRFYLAPARVTVMETTEPALPTAELVEEVGVPVLRPIERRTAAAALATAGSRTTR
jgi:hypothetical protein